MAIDPLYNEIDASTLEDIRKNVVWDNLFVDTPFQAKLRREGVLDPFLGGSSMTEPFIYGRSQGGAVAPGSTVTITRQQLLSALKFFPKAYVTWNPFDDWEVDDGSGTGGVLNSGPAKVSDLYTIMMENMTMTLNTMIEMDNFRHGQPSSLSVLDNRVLNINGVDEAINNGIDSSPFGNIYPTYGGATRNGVIGAALNAPVLWLGTATGGTGQIDFNALMKLWSAGQATGGKMDLGITNVWGFAAIANALDAQRRDVSNTKHDIQWDGFTFNGVDIYADPLAPSAQVGNYLSLAPAGGKAGNANLVDGAGVSTQTGVITTPQFTLNGANVAISPTGSGLPSNTNCTVGEVLYFFETSSFKLRPTNKSGWNFGLRQSPMPNNVSMDALFMRLGLNLYCVMPRHNALAYGFSA